MEKNVLKVVRKFERSLKWQRTLEKHGRRASLWIVILKQNNTLEVSQKSRIKLIYMPCRGFK